MPDLRGRAPIGQGSGPGLSPVVLGQSAGVDSVTIQTTNMPAHSHSVQVSTSPGSLTTPANNFIATAIDSQGGNVVGYNAAATAGATLAPTSVGLTGNSQPLNVQNPYLGINYIIATSGIFPSRN